MKLKSTVHHLEGVCHPLWNNRVTSLHRERIPLPLNTHLTLTGWYGGLWNKCFHESKGKYSVAEMGTRILLFFFNAQLALISQPGLQLAMAMWQCPRWRNARTEVYYVQTSPGTLLWFYLPSGQLVWRCLLGNSGSHGLKMLEHYQSGNW